MGIKEKLNDIGNCARCGETMNYNEEVCICNDYSKIIEEVNVLRELKNTFWKGYYKEGQSQPKIAAEIILSQENIILNLIYQINITKEEV